MRGVSGLPKWPVSTGEVLLACAETPPLNRIGRCAVAGVAGAMGGAAEVVWAVGRNGVGGGDGRGVGSPAGVVVAVLGMAEGVAVVGAVGGVVVVIAAGGLQGLA